MMMAVTGVTIVPMNKEQAAVARAYIAQLDKAGLWKKPIVTAIESYKAFYPAEDYHQDYIEKTGRACHVDINGAFVAANIQPTTRTGTAR